MCKKILKILIYFVILLICSFLISCSQSSRPTEEDIENSINEKLEPGLKYNSSEFKIFPSEQEGQGRISIKGNLILTEDRVEREGSQNAKLLQGFVSQYGVSNEQFFRYRNVYEQKLGKYRPIFYEKRLDKGSEIIFNGEMVYAETVDGFKLSGDLNYDICCSVASKLTGDFLLYGNEKYVRYFESLVSIHKNEIEKVLPHFDEVYSLLAKGGQILAGDKVVANINPFPIKNEPYTYGKALGQYRSKYAVKITSPIVIDVQSDFTMPNGRGMQKGMQIPLKLLLETDYHYLDKKKSCIGIKDGGKNGWYYYGYVCWNGELWTHPGTKHGKMIDNISKQHLSITDKVR